MPTNPSQNYFSFVVPGDSMGTSSAEFGMLVTGAVFGTPEREVEKISVPGVNGDYVFDHGKYSNIQVTYHCEIPKNFTENMFNFNADICRCMSDYVIVRDSYDTDHYRMGRFVGLTSPDAFAYAESGTVDVTFDCKPQRYEKDPERIDVSTTTTVENNTGYQALPILIVNHAGSFTITDSTGTGHTMTVSSDFFNNYATLIIDCESKMCFAQQGYANANQYVSGIFPTLEPGTNTVTVSNGLVMQINPMWWTL